MFREMNKSFFFGKFGGSLVNFFRLKSVLIVLLSLVSYDLRVIRRFSLLHSSKATFFILELELVRLKITKSLDLSSGRYL